MPFALVLWSMQNQCYEILQREYPHMLRQAHTGDDECRGVDGIVPRTWPN